MTKIFIDGKEGTTGLRIFDRLSLRDDLEILTLPERERKNPVLRKELLNTCDVALLCLPEDAALALGAWFLRYAVRLYRHYSDPLARATFKYSIWYLAALFSALLIDHYWR